MACEKTMVKTTPHKGVFNLLVIIYTINKDVCKGNSSETRIPKGPLHQGITTHKFTVDKKDSLEVTF